MQINLSKDEILEYIKKYKLLLFYLIITLIIIVAPLSLLSFSSIEAAEAALSGAEGLRNVSIWLFDNVFVPVMSLEVLLLLLILATRRRIVVLKRMNKKAAVSAVVVLMLIASGFSFISARSSERTKPVANKAIIITLDGTRYDVFWKADHWITQHRDEGAWAEKIIGTYPTVTYPNHISIFTGTWPQIHRCELGPNYAASRGYLFLRDLRRPVSEDIFSVANQYGMVTAAFLAPTLLASFLKAQVVKGGLEAEPAMNQAINFLKQNKDDIESRGLVMFIHLVDSDETMHEASTDSLEYESAIVKEANLVGELINNIAALGWENDTIIFVTADHGGIGYGHFNRYPPLVDEVPLYVWGGPIRKGVKLNGGRLIDIAPTIAFALGIRRPRDSVGVVLYRIFSDNALAVKGITSMDSVAVDEYKASIFRTYEDIVLYMWLAVTILFVLVITVRYLLLYRKELRKISPNFSGGGASKVMGGDSG